MAKKLYVGNLPFSTKEEDLRELFSAYGDVDEVAIISDRETGRSRGFAFVTMKEDAAADKAMEALNDSEQEGRKLVVNEARQKEERRNDRGGF